MSTSILTDVKKYLGLDSDYTCFDPDVIIGINSAFANLSDLGVGPEIPFRIEGGDETWDNFINANDWLWDKFNFRTSKIIDAETIKVRLLGFVKEYIPLRTRLMFDPPTSGFVLEAIQKRIDELEWRMNINAEEIDEEVNDE